jgi:hypothetical protein
MRLVVLAALAVLLSLAPPVSAQPAPVASADSAPPAPAAAVVPTLDVFALPPAELAAQARADLATVQRYAGQVQTIVDTLLRDGSMFRADHPLSPGQTQLLRSSWGALYGVLSACETIRQRWWTFNQRDLQSAAHAWGYVVTHTALLAELGVGGQFAELAVGSPAVEVLLDEPDDSFGVPSRAFEAWKLVVVHVGTAVQVLTGDAYLPMVRKTLKRHGVQASVEGRTALARWPTWSKQARRILTRDAGALFWRNTADLFKDWTRRAVLPPQKVIAEWMGDTRVQRVGRPLIGTLQVSQLKDKLQPGDVVLARQNWYLSNLGLPGFWPHAELVLGRPEHWTAAFDGDPAVQAWLAEQPEKPTTLAELVARRFPKGWRQYVEGKDYQGRGPIWVMESISEGVSLTAPEHAFQVDYVAVLRPQLPALIKAQALVRAFGYHGRPYDFDFDFLSDRTLVCTELVWKSYRPLNSGATGLRIDLVEVAGRPTLPANEIARLFDAEADLAAPQLAFVAYLEGQETGNTAVWRDAAAFRSTWKRLKWDVAQH